MSSKRYCTGAAACPRAMHSAHGTVKWYKMCPGIVPWRKLNLSPEKCFFCLHCFLHPDRWHGVCKEDLSSGKLSSQLNTGRVCRCSTTPQAEAGGCETHWKPIRSKSLLGIQRLPRLYEDLVRSWNVAQRDQRELQGVHSACTVQSNQTLLASHAWKLRCVLSFR